MVRVGFLFPGQGSQFVGMGKKLVAEHPIAREVFQEADEALGYAISKICFEGPESELTLTQNTQPAILTHSMAVLKVIEKETSMNPSLVAGHSLGEYSALVAAGALKFRDAVKAVRLRGQWMQEAVPAGQGGMLALIGVDETQALSFCKEVIEKSGQKGVLSPANMNGGGQVVVAGSQNLCQWAVQHAAELTAKPRRVVALQVSAPFHCALMKPAEEKLTAHFQTWKIQNLKCPYVANVDAEVHQDSEGIIPRLIRQVCSPVRWEASVKTMVASKKADEFWELGPGKVLSGLFKRIEKDAKVESLGGKYDVES